MDAIILLVCVVAFLFVLYMISPLLAPKQMNLMGMHVVITGGSFGIGFAVAKEAYHRGAHVTIIARKEAQLNEAKAIIEGMEKRFQNQKISAFSLDVTLNDLVPAVMQNAIRENGAIDVLINCAGTASSASFEDTPIVEFRRLMEINFFASVNATKAVLTDMKVRKSGRIVFVSSQAGQVGLYGFTAYSASKFALRGFAEALEMELKPFNIPITLVHPPDTQTPGFEEEEKNKPQITKTISQTAGLFSPEYVGRVLLDDVQSGKFLSFFGIDGFMLGCLSAGMSPVISIMEPLQQFFLMGIFRCVGLGYRRYFDYVVRRGVLRQEAEKR